MQNLRCVQVIELLRHFDLSEFVVEQLCEQLDRAAGFVIKVARHVVVTGKQPPQFVAPHDRHRHGRLNTHIPQIFEMDGRHSPCHAKRQVQRIAGWSCLWQDRIGCSVHIGNDAKQVLFIQFARLLGHVTGGIAQAQIRLTATFQNFCNDSSGPVLVKSVDHDTVHTGQRLDRACRFF